MDRQALTALFLIVILLTVGWLTQTMATLDLTWQTVIAIGAVLLCMILALVVILVWKSRGK